ncbi:MAG: DUF885 domain-containing protein [Lachnospiraceae bacterium]|nr:DUF885 domain-containing protein [Lachnospiraceae bacterium]
MRDWFITNVQGDTLTLHYNLSKPAAYNINDYNITLGSISSLDYKSWFEELEQLKHQLAGFDYNSLDNEGQLCYDVFSDYIDTELSAKNLYYFFTTLGPVTGIPVQYPVIFAEYAFYCEKDITDYLELLSRFSSLFDGIIQFEKEKAANGLGVSDRMLKDIFNICRAYVENKDTSFLITTFNERIDALGFLSDEKKEYYKEQNYQAVTLEFSYAYEKLINGLYELSGLGRNDSGLCWYENGKEYYDYLVRSRACSSYDTKKLLSLIENQVDSQMLKLSTLVTIDDSILDEWNQFAFPLTSPDEILNDLRSKIYNDFPVIPAAAYTIKNVDKSMEDILSPAFYLTPPIDATRNNVIYVNYGSPNISPASLYPTLAHEGYPGHLYQSVYYLNNCKTPARTLLGFKGYTEGWATYCEYYSYLLADTDNTRLTEARLLNSAIILGIYAMLDININYNYYTLEDTRRLIQKYFANVPDDAVENIFYAIIEEPANYLSYYSGYLEITKLKEEAQSALKDAFNLQEFHKFILDMGECSFRVIRKYFPAWLESQKSR